MTLLPASRGQRLLSNCVVATSQETGGRYSLYRIDLAARSGGARPHFHTRGDGRELSPEEWAALYARHDHVMVDEGKPTSRGT